ncbi:MAG: DUF934 domain-containing protein [Halioglobus sp.]
MPKLIKDGAIVENDGWLPMDPEGTAPRVQHILSLEQWMTLDAKTNSAVQLEPGQPPAPLLEHLNELALVAVNFPAFTDGRGFSYARELREKGFKGELRAVGGFIRDQMHYLHRCGFNAFALADDSELEGALSALNEFSEHYQAATDEPAPLFRRR